MSSIALQLYTVRQALTDDPEQTLRRVKAAGYAEVEVAPPSPELNADALAGILRSFDLRVVAAHADLPLGKRRTRVLDECAKLGTQRIIWHGWPKDSGYDSIDGIRRLADSYNIAADAAKEQGFEFGLHTHWWEFEIVHRRYPYQMFHELLEPDIFLEIDVYWAQTAGMNCVRVIEELRPRISMLHLKDGPAVHGQPMTALGQGVIDFPPILRSVDDSVDWVVELDECDTDPMEAAGQSLSYLRRLKPELA